MQPYTPPPWANFHNAEQPPCGGKRRKWRSKPEEAVLLLPGLRADTKLACCILARGDRHSVRREIGIEVPSNRKRNNIPGRHQNPWCCCWSVVQHLSDRRPPPPERLLSQSGATPAPASPSATYHVRVMPAAADCVQQKQLLLVFSALSVFAAIVVRQDRAKTLCMGVPAVETAQSPSPHATFPRSLPSSGASRDQSRHRPLPAHLRRPAVLVRDHMRGSTSRRRSVPHAVWLGPRGIPPSPLISPFSRLVEFLGGANPGLVRPQTSSLCM
jgi:hypothetical protein